MNERRGESRALGCGACFCSWSQCVSYCDVPCVSYCDLPTQAAQPCTDAEAAAAPPCVATHSLPPCIPACITDRYIYQCFRWIRRIVPIFDCINECGSGLPGGPITGGFGGFGR